MKEEKAAQKAEQRAKKEKDCLAKWPKVLQDSQIVFSVGSSTPVPVTPMNPPSMGILDFQVSLSYISAVFIIKLFN